MGQTVTDLPSNATPSDLGLAVELEKPATEYTDPVESAFEDSASVTEPEVEVTAQGNIGRDPEKVTEQPDVQDAGSVTLTRDEVYELNMYLSHNQYTLREVEMLKPIFDKLKTPTGRGGWWGWGLGLMDRF